MSEENSGEFNIHEAANEVIAESESQAASTSEVSTDGQATQDAPVEKTGEETQASPEDILKKVSEEKEDPAQFADLLKGVNSLGMIRNGLPIGVDSPEQLKELIQKGFDYTQKTMEHAEIVKAKSEEFQQKESLFMEKEAQLVQKEQEISDVIFSNQILGSIVQKLQSEDPELFAHLDQLYRKEETTLNLHKPIEAKFQGEIQKLSTEIQGLKGQKQAEELGKIKSGWEKELSEVQSKIAAPLAKLGVKGNWDKVKEVWSADASGTMTVEQALYAVHGPDIAKANESHQKLLQTRAKTQSAMLNRTGVGAGQKGQEETIKAPMGDYESILRQASITM